MSADKERIAELETANALYQSDAERIWSLMPELRNTDAHYGLHEAVQHKIAKAKEEMREECAKAAENLSTSDAYEIAHIIRNRT